MNTICFLFIFVFEQFISYLYFTNKFASNRRKRFLFFCYTFSFILQYLINLFNIPYLNLLSFFVFNSIVLYLCYQVTIKQVLFNIFLLEGIMITTELIIMYLTTALFKIELTDYQNNTTIILLETIGSKSLYFIFAYIISKVSSKETNNKGISNLSYMFFVLPLTSILTIASFGYISVNIHITNIINIIFLSTALILLFSNMLVFLVHEKMLVTLTQNMELQLEKQKEKINDEYYADLERQYDSSHILIHDIKNHLSTIRELSLQNENSTAISQYINSIYEGNSIKTLRTYSENKLVNVIISRYAQLCDEKNIEFFVDIRNIDFSFIASSDLTSLLDNLLKNAYEAVEKSNEKEISLSIDHKNEMFVLINISNSSDIAPKVKGKLFETSKTDKQSHGFGLKSILKIVKKYNGNFEYAYDANAHKFKASIILKSI